MLLVLLRSRWLYSPLDSNNWGQAFVCPLVNTICHSSIILGLLKWVWYWLHTLVFDKTARLEVILCDNASWKVNPTWIKYFSVTLMNLLCWKYQAHALQADFTSSYKGGPAKWGASRLGETPRPTAPSSLTSCSSGIFPLLAGGRHLYTPPSATSPRASADDNSKRTLTTIIATHDIKLQIIILTVQP